MPQCIPVKKKFRKVCLGDLRDRIVIQDRNIKAPQNGVDYSEQFDRGRKRRAMINTVRGSVFFDDLGQQTVITHDIYFRYDKSLTTQNWILFDGKRFKILELTNLDERRRWLLAECTDKGDKNKLASGA